MAGSSEDGEWVKIDGTPAPGVKWAKRDKALEAGHGAVRQVGDPRHPAALDHFSCSQCGNGVKAADNFCSACGVGLTSQRFCETCGQVRLR